ncbi:MAG: hypothetical protein EHM46_06030 [Bacteroidetes bacterium]|nr:MAG: hypothetical protein EHM46_06030 [Bacteroidota bacterium]
MQHKILISILASIPLLGSAQSPVWNSWDAETVRMLNTASETSYMTEEEKKVLLFMNMARHDGTLFADTFLDAYVNDKQMDNSSELRSLYRDLKKTEDVAPLIPREDLSAVAQGYAVSSGQSGYVGHKDFNNRYGPLMGNPYSQVGENCSYGFDQAIDIVLMLLIDEGVKDLGHRNNILNAGFNSAGVAIRPHKKYRVNCVTSFGRQDRSSLNEVPY